MNLTPTTPVRLDLVLPLMPLLRYAVWCQQQRARPVTVRPMLWPGLSFSYGAERQPDGLLASVYLRTGPQPVVVFRQLVFYSATETQIFLQERPASRAEVVLLGLGEVRQITGHLQTRPDTPGWFLATLERVR